MIDYNNFINKKISTVKPSGIRKFFDIANEMDDVISLSIGEPDFQTPWHIREEGINSLKKGKTWYSPNRGFAELREEIAAYYKRRFGIEYDAKKQTLVTVGGSEAIDLVFRTLLDPGDEVIIPEPSFVCYEPLTVMADGVPVIINTKNEDNFRLKASDLRAAITPKTKLLVLPFPNNPTGAIMEREDLEEIAEVIKEYNIFILSDEIYCELTYGNKNHVSIAEIDGMYERTIVVNGFSKSYAMTGWRLGYACAPELILKQMLKIHQFAIMCAPTTSQYAAVEALKNGDKDVAEMRGAYDQRRRYLVKALRDMGFDCYEPQGAFYVFPSIKKFGMTSDEFALKLLEEEKVAVVPGTAFGDCGEGYLRISYAYSLNDLKRALERMERFVKRHLNEAK